MAGLGRGLSSLLSDSKKSKEEKSTDVLNTLQHTSNNKENIVIDEGSKVVEIDFPKSKEWKKIIFSSI